MAGETVVTIVGNLTSDPELRFTPAGAAVASFTVASTPRTYDKQSNEWRDGDALFLRCSAWRQLGENVAEGLRKGDRVVVVGRLKQRSFDDKDGNHRTVIELDADEVAASAKFATVTAQRASRGSHEPASSGGFGGGRDSDPWATSGGDGSAWDRSPAGAGSSGSEPPF